MGLCMSPDDSSTFLCPQAQGSNVQRVLLDQVSRQRCLTDVGLQVRVELFQLPWDQLLWEQVHR